MKKLLSIKVKFFFLLSIEQSYSARVNSAEPQFLESHFTLKDSVDRYRTEQNRKGREIN